MNKYQPHIKVLVEDDAIRQVANGFFLNYNVVGRIQIMPTLGGWPNVKEEFETIYVTAMRNNLSIYCVLIIDFDEDLDRRTTFNQIIPKDLRDRVILIGAFDEVEDLCREEGKSKENMGKEITRMCSSGGNICNINQLKHNKEEVDQYGNKFRELIFGTSILAE